MAQWWESSPPSNVARVQIPASTPYVGWGSRVLWKNPNPDFRIQKRISRFLGANPKTDHESIKSTLRVDSSDQIQIPIFEIHNLSVFLGGGGGKGFEKGTFDKRFFEKNGT